MELDGREDGHELGAIVGLLALPETLGAIEAVVGGVGPVHAVARRRMISAIAECRSVRVHDDRSVTVDALRVGYSGINSVFFRGRATLHVGLRLLGRSETFELRTCVSFHLGLALIPRAVHTWMTSYTHAVGHKCFALRHRAPCERVRGRGANVGRRAVVVHGARLRWS